MFSLLHIDNNFFYKEILRDLSEQNDFRYFSAKTPQKAYEILVAHDIDLIVTGLEFKGENKERFISTLMRKKRETTPVIVLSAINDMKLKAELFQKGISDYLTKDHFMEYLMTLIKKNKGGDAIAAELRNLWIAVLDDSVMHLNGMRAFFEHNAMPQVDYFINPAALLTTAKTYNIYLIDNVLPDISGEEVIREIRKRDEYAVIIAVSSVNSHAVISNILSNGADDYIVKPFSENLFMARLKANVRTYSLMQQLKEKNRLLAQVAQEDGLTGLYNRRAIMERLNREIDFATRSKEPLTVLMFDIDRFKMINDTYGHHLGDEVLRQLGQYLKNAFQKNVITGRYGGEEFICVFPGLALSGAVVYAERLRRECGEMRFSEDALSITVSGGVAAYSDENADEFLKRVDELLYKAKKNGRNRMEY
ncbi:diguanylate cyclase [Azotosporobacter soli]|uniref:GGDEF domain-containing response regulator n=1 Tax=Azotosporobacter soli TaxID=3055040 RepID=UPI0031FE8FF6